LLIVQLAVSYAPTKSADALADIAKASIAVESFKAFFAFISFSVVILMTSLIWS